jgi:hypothetical protein
MTIYYLYIKTHNKTGLKYLGKTIRDPYQYKGSGKRWSAHIKKHGYDVTTEILRECASNEEIKEWGLYYSKLWNIVDSLEWANLKLEEGDGGNTFGGRKHKESTLDLMREKANLRPPVSEKTKLKMSRSKTGVSIKLPPRTKEHQEALNKSLKGKPAWNKGVTGYKNSSQVVTCPHCGKTGGSGGIKRFHFGNCKSRQ